MDSNSRKIKIEINYIPEGKHIVNIKNLREIELRGITIGDSPALRRIAGTDDKKFTVAFLSKVIITPKLTLEQLSDLSFDIIKDISLEWLTWYDSNNKYCSQLSKIQPENFYKEFRKSINNIFYDEIRKMSPAVINSAKRAIDNFHGHLKNLGLASVLNKFDLPKDAILMTNILPPKEMTYIKQLQDIVDKMPKEQLFSNLKKSLDINSQFAGILNKLPKTPSILSVQNALSETNLKEFRFPETDTFEQIITWRSASENVFKVNKKIHKVLVDAIVKQDKFQEIILGFYKKQKLHGNWLIILTIALVVIAFFTLVVLLKDVIFNILLKALFYIFNISI